MSKLNRKLLSTIQDYRTDNKFTIYSLASEGDVIPRTFHLVWKHKHREKVSFFYTTFEDCIEKVYLRMNKWDDEVVAVRVNPITVDADKGL